MQINIKDANIFNDSSYNNTWTIGNIDKEIREKSFLVLQHVSVISLTLLIHVVSNLMLYSCCFCCFFLYRCLIFTFRRICILLLFIYMHIKMSV